MKYITHLFAAALVCASAFGQSPEFEVASIKPIESTGFFHASDSATGGPGSADPVMFRCTCALSSLITRAFGLQKYQFPGQQALPRDTFSVWAKVPEGTTPEQFRLMLQNLLKSRFDLAYHFDKKEIQGYQLTLAKGGSKLKESNGATEKASGEHSGHGGLTFTMGGLRYRADHQSSGQIAQTLSDQIAKPVEDLTGLGGAYDVALSWSGESAHDHQPGAQAGGWGGPGHGDHGGGGSADSAPGPTIFDAVQAQLGLKLIASKKATTQMLVVDHINKVASGN